MTNQKILVIDDDEGILEAIKAVLDYEGYKVEIDPTGEKILTQSKSTLPDLILLDLLLSGKDGTNVISKIKQHDHLKKIPIIMLSAHPTAAQAAKEAGATDFLAKPFDIFELLKKINHHLGKD